MTSADTPNPNPPKAKRSKAAARPSVSGEPETPATADSEPEPEQKLKAATDPHLLAHHAAVAAEKAVAASQFSPGLGSSLPVTPRK